MTFLLCCLAGVSLLALVVAIGIIRGSRDLPRPPRRSRW